ncbi:SAF domain-containing protein [Lignipirellula cremea]|uniref:SAF domain-containing protein n=1 Tax=Lignipirellula cremea TaxID=2528010 RepID=A0A518E419_9BACT|nr:SAF domain-containing protein [Lignipirellula cremea]QDU98839.1 hypothetical protein Pla8534_67500 [Lignipirellula cremea]
MSVTAHHRRRSRLGLLALIPVALAMLGAGVVLSLWVLGVPLNFWQQEKPQANPYLVRIPINVRPIPAHTSVDRNDLLDSQTGWLKFQELPPRSVIGMAVSGIGSRGELAEGKITAVRQLEGQLIFVLSSGEEVPQSQTNELGGALMNVGAIIGRVVKQDKKAGLGFREDNFFPRGTPAGIAGATPPGMRSLVLEAGKLQGVHTLPAGARIDLIANVPLDELTSFDRGQSSRLPGAALLQSSSSKRKTQGGASEPILLAQEALVLRPVYQRVEAETSSSLTQGKRVQAVPVYEVALAMHPGDVIPLQTALNKGLEVICVAHSMQASGTADSPTPRPVDGPVAPVISRSILAYEVLTYDYFEDAATRRIRHEPVTAEEIERSGIITSLDQLVGVVVKHDIPKGSFITHADLLQVSPALPTPTPRSVAPPLPIAPERHVENKDEGLQEAAIAHDGFHFITQRQPASEAEEANLGEAAGDDRRNPRPNIVGEVPTISKFIPPGYKAAAIPWNRLYGAEHLQIGDVVDLTVSYSLQYEAESKEQERQPDGTVIDRTIKRRMSEPTERTYDETLGFRGEPWFAAIDAKVIGPVGYPPPAPATRFLGESLFQPSASGADTRSGPPIMFAIAERDQEAVSAALATNDATFSIVIHPPGGEASAPAGWKRIVLATEGIAAFERLTSTQLEQRHTRRLMTRLVRVDDAEFDNALTEAELRPFLGRVLRRYKVRHAFFTEEDFFPSGIEPGLSADIGSGSTVYVAADHDIEGLEHFRDNDRIAILYRGLIKPPAGVITHGLDLERPVASVIVPAARILRASQEGTTVLEISTKDLARLQAAWAASFSPGNGDQAAERRLNLVAVSLPSPAGETRIASEVRQATPTSTPAKSPEDIPGFDPLSNVRVLEAIVGDRRKTHVFAGDSRSAANRSDPFSTGRP